MAEQKRSRSEISLDSCPNCQRFVVQGLSEKEVVLSYLKALDGFQIHLSYMLMLFIKQPSFHLLYASQLQ